MTRQKKELHKKIDKLQTIINIESELGCGFTPADWFEAIYEQMEELYEELAHLSHFSTMDRYIFDKAGELADLR